MTEERWVNESLYSDWGQRFRIQRLLAHVRSPFQDILVFESASHGRVMMLDGCTQITERDEFVYQEMLGHVPLLEHGNARRILIIGAGDGGVLRRVLAHRNVEAATLVEVDGEVVRLSKEYLPDIAGDAWSDPRARLLIGDGIDFVRHAQPASFDVIIVDSTDPAGVGEVLFTETFYKNCARILTDDGLLVNQGGVPFMQAEELTLTSQRQQQAFSFVTAYVVAVPTYVGGFMALGLAAKGRVPLRDLKTIRSRSESQGVLNNTSYWTPEIHVGSFNLPPYVSRLLDHPRKTEVTTGNRTGR